MPEADNFAPLPDIPTFDDILTPARRQRFKDISTKLKEQRSIAMRLKKGGLNVSESIERIDENLTKIDNLLRA